MAIVREYLTSAGVHVLISDEYYRDRTPEQRAADVRLAQRTAWRVAENVMLRQVQALEAQGMDREAAIVEARRLMREAADKFWARPMPTILWSAENETKEAETPEVHSDGDTGPAV